MLLGSLSLMAQSPHGESLRIDCGQCHNASGWDVALNEVKFDHGTTNFDLEGTHTQTDCRMCHSSLVFDEAPMSCVDCHLDVHSMSVGNDCVRCHNADSWLVDEIPELHEMNGFPLMGAHAALSCVECHFAETNLRFDRIGNECINCHRDDYDNAENPNHAVSGFSTNCTDCHSPLGFGWGADPISHDFFPLVMGHDISDCTECHNTGNFADADPNCVSCHQSDFVATTNPPHVDLNFSNDCAMCHSLEPDWMPAEFLQHDNQFFPIYSGEHQGVWNDCVECHNVPGNFAVFTCFTCHLEGPTADEHGGVSGYVYESASCFSCHPQGE
ncbi:MAG: cytochrome c3 family protein [Bacteroidota bacterium]